MKFNFEKNRRVTFVLIILIAVAMSVIDTHHITFGEEIIFNKRIGSYVTSAVSVGDIDGDGNVDIVAAGDAVHVWNLNGIYLRGWPKSTENLIASTPTIGDINNDSIPEIAVGSDDDSIWVWDSSGKVISGFPLKTGNDVFSNPLFIDITDDGIPEIIFGSDDGKIYAIDNTGKNVDGWPRVTGGFVSASPIAEDINGDGNKEIIIPSWDGSVLVLNKNGSDIDGWPQQTGDPIWYGAAVFDIDGDGLMEIGAASDQVYLWHSNGSLVDGWPQKIGTYAVGIPHFRDIDLDGKVDIIIGSDALYAWNSNGEPLKGFPVDLGAYIWATVETANIGPQNSPTIIAGTWKGELHAVLSDGSEISGWPFKFKDRIFAKATVFSHENKTAIAIGSWDGRIIIISIDHGERGKSLTKSSFPEGNIIISKPKFKNLRNGIIVAKVEIAGSVRNARFIYRGHEGDWHPSPLVISGDHYEALISPQPFNFDIPYHIDVTGWDEENYRYPEFDTFDVR